MNKAMKDIKNYIPKTDKERIVYLKTINQVAMKLMDKNLDSEEIYEALEELQREKTKGIEE